jgi:hypothetical protein
VSSVWPRSDAECSPERGSYYHPSRHSAGVPIVAGWAYQFIARLGFARESWTAPVDASRVHPDRETNMAAAKQVEALLGRSAGEDGASPCSSSTPAMTPSSSNRDSRVVLARYSSA